MRGQARIVAEARPGGGTRLTSLFASGTVSVWPLPAPAGSARVHLVSRAAGPLGGDRTRLDVRVGSGARLAITSAAAAVALPGPDGQWSTAQVHAHIAADGALCWQPQPLVLTARALHRSAAYVTVDDGGAVVWWEELVLGRSGERPGSLTTRLMVDHAGTPLVRHDLRIGPASPGWDSYAGLGPYRIHVTVCAVGVTPSCRDDVALLRSPTAALLACHGPGLLITAAGNDLQAARRFAITGLSASHPRIWPVSSASQQWQGRVAAVEDR